LESQFASILILVFSSPVILYCLIFGNSRESMLPQFGRSFHELVIFLNEEELSVTSPRWHSRLVDGVGCSDGDVVGTLVGEAVGVIVGPSVGVIVGTRVGKEVGPSVGCSVGDVVGKSVGPSVGSNVGEDVGELVCGLL
jgi:hypothetical protein